MRKLTYKEAIRLYFESPEDAVGSEYDFDDDELRLLWQEAYYSKMDYHEALGALEEYLIDNDEDADEE